MSCMSGFGLDVPTEDGGLAIASGTPPMCGEPRATQQMLKDLGYYGGKVDGVPGPKTLVAMQQFAADSGVSLPGAVTPQYCEALMGVWSARQAASAQPAPATQAGAPRTLSLSPGVWQRLPGLTTMLETVRSGETTTAPPAETNGGESGTLSSVKDWWNKQSETTQYAIIGGGALVALLVVWKVVA